MKHASWKVIISKSETGRIWNEPVEKITPALYASAEAYQYWFLASSF